MKPHFHKVPVSIQNSFSIRHDIQENFGNIWHYHPELELHYVIRGEGVRFIGNNISSFASEEIILLGENLPHTWRCSDEYFQNNPSHEVEAIVIHFLPDSLGKDILKLPEAYLIPKLFEKAKKGMQIKGEHRERLAKLMLQAKDCENLDRLIVMLSILKELAEADDYTILNPGNVQYQSDESDMIRLNKVYNYTLTNFKREISVQEVASVSNLSVTSFCRYFKQKTKKTYYDFLIEIRVSHACRLLIEDKYPTNTICYQCGFNNVSNFYKHFKKVTGITPLEYKRKYLAE